MKAEERDKIEEIIPCGTLLHSLQESDGQQAER